ncbi:hypothetical protein LINPERHAP1_LOCUS19150 [Linum perenne]
MATKL